MTFCIRLPLKIGLWELRTFLDNVIEVAQDARSNFSENLIELNKIIWWDSEGQSSFSCGTMLIYSGKHAGSKRRSGLGLILMVTARRILIP